MAISGYQRYCLNLQGYSRLSDEAKRQVDLAQRFKPAVCAAVAVVAVVTQSLPVALLGVLLGYWAAFFPGHPADVVYRGVLQPLLHAPDLGPDPAPRRFACGMAATLLLIGALGWAAGLATVGQIFVGVTALSLLALVVGGFCTGSFVYWLVVRRRVFLGS